MRHMASETPVIRRSLTCSHLTNSSSFVASSLPVFSASCIFCCDAPAMLIAAGSHEREDWKSASDIMHGNNSVALLRGTMRQVCYHSRK